MISKKKLNLIPIDNWNFQLEMEFILYNDAVLSLLTYLGRTSNYITDFKIINKDSGLEIHINDIEEKYINLDAQNISRLAAPLTTDYLLTYTRNHFRKGHYKIIYKINATNNIAFYHIVNDNFIKIYETDIKNYSEKSIRNYLVNHSGLTFDIGYDNSSLFRPLFLIDQIESGFTVNYPKDALIEFNGNIDLSKYCVLDFSEMIQFNLSPIPIHTNINTIKVQSTMAGNLYFYDNNGIGINHTGTNGFISTDFYNLEPEAIRTGNKLWFFFTNRNNAEGFKIRSIKLSCIN